MNIINFIKKYIYFNFNKINIIPLAVLIINILVLRLLNITVIYENSLLENLQLIALFLPILFAFRAKNHKAFFNLVIMVLILMIAREISYGRVIFGAIDGQPNAFYRWSDYKYGFLVNYIIGIYIAIMILYAFFKKIYLDVFVILRKVKMPFWSVFFCGLCTIGQVLGEGILENTVLEETSEMVLYTIISVLVVYYAKKLNKTIHPKQIHQ